MERPFWKSKTLSEMTVQEWESLCDGCGQCCLIKLEDEDTGNIAVTKLACKLLDLGTCQCSNYGERQTYVPDCVKLEHEDVAGLAWLPETCAYRKIAQGEDLAWWHPLVSGNTYSVHEAGISIRNRAISETLIAPERHVLHISYWIEAK